MIIDDLMSMQDVAYRNFQSKLIPTADKETFIGIRTPALRDYAKKMVKAGGYEEFLGTLPHKYFDENQLHAFILSEIKDFDKCVEYVDAFLSYVDNWATCDQMSPKVFKKNRDKLLPKIREWITSDKTYTVRFGIGMLMQHFFDGDFKEEYLRLVAGVKSEEYYINMMVAWYFATALSKQYDATIPYIEKRVLDPWTHKKTIQKAIESYRITDEQKVYLRILK